MPNEITSVFVTGASGFIGAEVCRSILSLNPNANVYGLVRSELQAARLKREGVKTVVGDLTNPDTYGPYLQRCTHVFHVAAEASFKSGNYARDNIEGTRLLLAAIKECVPGLKRLVFTSTIGAVERLVSDRCLTPLDRGSVPNPSSAYGQSKLAAERMISESGLPFTTIRLPWVYGPHMRSDSHLAVLAQMVARNSFLTKMPWPGRVSMIYVKDLAGMLAALVESSEGLNQSYFVSDGRPLSFKEIFARLRSNPASKSGLAEVIWNTFRPFSPVGRLLSFQLRCLLEDVMVCKNELADILPNTQYTPFEEALSATIDGLVKRREGVVIVTGAASGIGLSIARQLAERGTNILLIDKSPTVADIAQSIGAISMTLDLSSESLIDELTAFLSERCLRVSGIVHSAGVGFKGDVSVHSQNKIKEIVCCNFEVAARMVALLATDIKLTKGFIMLVASSVADVPLPGMAVYAASKAAILSLGRSLWAELLPHDVRVLTVCPPGTKTSFQKQSGVKVVRDGRGLLSPDRVATKSLNALFRSRRPVLRWYSVSTLVFDLLDFLPETIRLVALKKIFAKAR